MMFGPPPWREPDAVDQILIDEAARLRHERRMKRIREMDVEQWASNLYGGSDT